MHILSMLTRAKAASNRASLCFVRRCTYGSTKSLPHCSTLHLLDPPHQLPIEPLHAHHFQGPSNHTTKQIAVLEVLVLLWQLHKVSKWVVRQHLQHNQDRLLLVWWSCTIATGSFGYLLLPSCRHSSRLKGIGLMSVLTRCIEAHDHLS